MHTKFSLESLKETEYSRTLNVDGGGGIKLTRNIRLEGVDWINLAQSTERWRALVNTVINLLVP
jgi:hypothetical protein